ncbi:ribonucleotide reductase N-terminal alpha domain-containing protein, partial [Patescibacteria group bacterium]
MAYELTGLRQDVFYDRYALKDDNGERIEDTPNEMWHRVAKAIATNETTIEKKQLWEQKFFEALENFKFIPAGRILSGAGANA